ncbi:hypothetical protein BDV93DRAFT_515758 [Ceratobasidium sp. AG-I]|nr:hypothetical protein BDV93DRAFT_515758 [Ceratobasidium sp. AG-I]
MAHPVCIGNPRAIDIPAPLPLSPLVYRLSGNFPPHSSSFRASLALRTSSGTLEDHLASSVIMENTGANYRYPLYTWITLRLLASLLSGKAEHRSYGPMDLFMQSLFFHRRPPTALTAWMMKPQVSLREVQAGHEPNQGAGSDSEDEGDEPVLAHYFSHNEQHGHDAGDISVGNTTIDSQNNPVVSDRRQSKHPDFAVAKARIGLTNDIHHLYIEMKNGNLGDAMFARQMRKYLQLAAAAIPPTMSLPVYFLLINGSTSCLWVLHRDTAIGDQDDIMTLAERFPTMHERWWAIMNEVASRV